MWFRMYLLQSEEFLLSIFFIKDDICVFNIYRIFKCHDTEFINYCALKFSVLDSHNISLNLP